MAKKGRRRVQVGTRTFLWYVTEDCDDFPSSVGDNLLALNVISEDKHFIGRYHLGQEDERTRHITVMGNEFGGADCVGPWRRFRCRDWVKGDAVTPRHVRAIIQWCLDESKDVEPVEWQGEPMP